MAPMASTSAVHTMTTTSTLAVAEDLRSEDTDSIMTDELEEAIDEHASPLASPSAAHHTPIASTSTAPWPGANTRPSGPMCEFGDRLGYTYFSKPVPTAEQLNAIHKHTATFWLTVDNDLTYLSFFKDTGPLNVGCLYRFCLHLHELLDNAQIANKRIVLFSSDAADKKANASLLMALYAMIVLRWSPADALHPLACLELKPFRDAGYARADFHLSAQDVLFGTRKAIDNRLLKLDEFNIQEYEYYEKVENGDWNYITPHFLAFASPVEQGYEAASKSKVGGLAPKISKSFKNVLEYFEKNGVKMVVRLNKKLYDEKRFIERGMQHREMYFDDGTNPTLDMCREFIDLSEAVIRSGGVVAVHCKAGLGRTGTLIGAYLIYKYGFSATEVIGFMRLMRPGTCVGPQQHFMYENQMTWVRWGAIDRYKAENPSVLVGIERPITPPTDDENACTISTPRAVTPPVPSTHAVPGQPRKTPGAKTRHAVSAPESVDKIDDDVFVDQLETQAQQAKGARAKKESSPTPSVAPSQPDEEMQLVVDEVLILPQRRKSPLDHDSENMKNPPAYLASAAGIREITPPVLGDVTAGHHARASSRVGKSGRPQRPLTTITDNRQVDKIPTLSFADSNSGRAGSVPRSKGVSSGLGTVLEDKDNSPSSQGSDRYNLRTGRVTAPLGTAAVNHSASNQARPGLPHHPSTSPSRLPKRIVSKRKAAVESQAKTAGQLGAGLPGSVTVPAGRSVSGTRAAATHGSAANAPSTRLGRTTRRRRSSTGEVA